MLKNKIERLFRIPLHNHNALSSHQEYFGSTKLVFQISLCEYVKSAQSYQYIGSVLVYNVPIQRIKGGTLWLQSGIQYARKKWIVTWKSHGASLRHDCDSEQAALTVSRIQETISRKELLLGALKRRKSISVRELFDLHFLRCTKSPLTIKQDMYHAKPLLDFFSRQSSLSITRADISAFCSIQKQAGKAQSTIHRRISLLRSIMNWGWREGLLPEQIERWSIPKGKNRRTPPPTISELSALLHAASPHIRRVILLDIYTGARVGPSELFSLTWDDVDLAHGVISMPSANKGGRLENVTSRSGRNSCRYLHNGNARTETALTSFPGRGNPSARLVRPGKQRFARRVSALLDHMIYAMPMPPTLSVPESLSKPARKSWAMNRQE